MSITTLGFSDLVNPHQYKIVDAYSSAIIYELKIPPDCLGWIERIATSDWVDGTYMTWLIDGVPYGGRIERTIAPIDYPSIYSPPIGPVNHYVRWIGYNNSPNNVIFEVLCDGIIVNREWGRKMFK